MVAAKKSKTQVLGLDNHVVMVVAPSGGSAATRSQSGTKRSADDGLGAVGPAQRRLQHSITGVNKEFRDKVQIALSDLDLTKDVAELQFVMDQVTKVAQELQRQAGEQEARTILLTKRFDAVDPAMDQMTQDIKGVGKRLGDKLVVIDNQRGSWEKMTKNREDELMAKLATQEAVLTERIEEIKGLFKKCDDVFEHTGGAKPADTPATTSVAGAPPGLKTLRSPRQSSRKLRPQTSYSEEHSMPCKWRSTSYELRS